MQEVVYRSGSQLRHPWRILREMASDLREAAPLAWRLLVRNVSAQYRQSLLGYVWLLVPPLVMAGAWVFLNDADVVAVGATDVPYPVFVLVGTVLWNGFVEALNAPLRHLSEAQQLLTKVRVPAEAIVLAGLGEVAFNLAVRLGVVALVCLGLGFVPPWMALLSPLGIGPLLLLGVAGGLLLAPFGLLYGDVQRGIGVVTTFWFFITPVAYPLPLEGLASLVAYGNPVSPLLMAARDLLTRGSVQAPLAALLVAGIALALLLASWGLFRVALPHIVFRLGNR